MTNCLFLAYLIFSDHRLDITRKICREWEQDILYSTDNPEGLSRIQHPQCLSDLHNLISLNIWKWWHHLLTFMSFQTSMRFFLLITKMFCLQMFLNIFYFNVLKRKDTSWWWVNDKMFISGWKCDYIIQTRICLSGYSFFLDLPPDFFSPSHSGMGGVCDCFCLAGARLVPSFAGHGAESSVQTLQALSTFHPLLKVKVPPQGYWALPLPKAAVQGVR